MKYTTPSRATHYEVRVRGHLDTAWMDWLDGWSVTLLDDGDTVLTGLSIDQSRLYGLLSRLRDLNMKLISVRALEYDTKEDKT